MKNTNLTFLIIFKLLILPLSAYSSDSCPTTSSPYSKKLLAQNDYIDISADNSTLNNRNEILLQGNVELLSSNFFLSADNITFNRDKKNYRASGDVRYLNEFISTDANEIIINDDFINAKKINFEFQNDSGRGSAEVFEGNSNKQIIENSIFTNCPPQNPGWKISSKKLILDKENNIGLAKDAKLEFFDIPILYLPYLEWPLEGRGSGFLSPSFSKYTESDSNTSENSISIPYYLNIAKDKDFLISLDYMSSRGSNISSKYRQLLYSDIFDSGYFEFQNNYLSNDKVTKNDRWLTKAKLNIDISEFLKFNAENFRVSDKSYFKEINNNFSDSDLFSFLKLNYSKNNLDLDFEHNNVQYIDESSTSFIYAPRINAKKSINFESGELNLSANAVKFKNNSSSLNGSNRLHYEASVKEKFENNEFQIEPEIGLLYTHYDIKGADAIDRNILKLGVDTRIELEREFDFNGTSIIQSFSPRLKYNYVQKENQSNINNFDTEEFSLDALTIYQTQDFTGLDKISSSNSLVYGFDTEFFNSNGEQLFGTSIAQKKNIDDKKIGLDGNFISNRNFSDVYTTTSLILKNSKIDLLLNYDPYNNKTSSSILSYNFFSSPKKIFNFSYIHDSERSLSYSASFPLTKELTFLGSVNHNLITGINNKSLFGLSYQSCCWEFTAVKFDGNNSIQNDSLEFELTFKDLGSSSNSLKNRIKSEIPNYLNLNDF